MPTATIEPGIADADHATLGFNTAVHAKPLAFNVAIAQSFSAYGIALTTSSAQKIPVQHQTGPQTEFQVTVTAKGPLTIEDLGWTKEQAAEVRGLFAAFAPDWDDPSMDVFDEY